MKVQGKFATSPLSFKL